VAATATAALAQEKATAAPLLPTVKLGKHSVTRLILGGNPIYGHSHFNRLLSKHMTDWHTPDRVVELLSRCEKAGINTWQNSYAERTLQDLDRARKAGLKFHWLCLGKPDWDRYPERVAEAAKRKPIGIAPHGALAERLRRQKKLPALTDLLKRIRDQGVLVGLSAHDPAAIELARRRAGTWTTTCAVCTISHDRARSSTSSWARRCPWGRSTCRPTRRACSGWSRRSRSRAWCTRCWRPAGASEARPRCGRASRRR